MHHLTLNQSPILQLQFRSCEHLKYRDGHRERKKKQADVKVLGDYY